MENGNHDFWTGKFSEDRIENLKLENEILELRCRAELGTELLEDRDISPELKHAFLRNVLDFDLAYHSAERGSVYNLLNKPPIKKAAELSDEEIAVELERLSRLLAENGIIVEYRADYPVRPKYIFITEELFHFETEYIRLPGLSTHFSYEEFHPNHALDIEECAREFLKAWFNPYEWTEESSWWLNTELVLPQGFIVPKCEIIDRINNVRKKQLSGNGSNFVIDRVHFEVIPEHSIFLGHAAGSLVIEMVKEHAVPLPVSGHFKLFMCNESGCWNIIYFVFPGFSWE